ncbi:10385_t:CDS:1, partial [Acaulospora morrowiae]
QIIDDIVISHCLVCHTIANIPELTLFARTERVNERMNERMGG